MKPIIILFLSMACASAQYRYTLYSSTVATNAYIPTNSYTTYNTAFAVAAGSAVQIQLAFKIATNDYPHWATNDIITTWQSSMDGSRYTNQFQFTLKSTATATNTEVWGLTNFAVTYPWLKLISISNMNQARLTNHSVKVGQKTGI
jgi:hypothetical protein